MFHDPRIDREPVQRSEIEIFWNHDFSKWSEGQSDGWLCYFDIWRKEKYPGPFRFLCFCMICRASKNYMILDRVADPYQREINRKYTLFWWKSLIFKIEEKSWKNTKIGTVQDTFIFFIYQSNIINRLIAPPTTLKKHDFKKFRAVISLDHETLTIVLLYGIHGQRSSRTRTDAV